MEYRHERYFQNIFCEFRNRQVEADFMEYEKTTDLRIVRILILIMGFIFALFIVSDYYYFQNEIFSITSLMLRGAGLLTAFVAFFLAGKFRHYNSSLLMITSAELIIFILYLINLYTLKNNEPVLQFMSVLLQILAVCLIPNRWRNCFFAGCFIWIGYIVFCVIFKDTSGQPSLALQGIYLGVLLLSCCILTYSRESTERKHFAAVQLMEYMSITDRLTGIYNRGRFKHMLGIWIKNMRHDPFCLLLFDIDNFKKVNDTFGHYAGDEVLVRTTELVAAHIRDDDIFARWGGEEFVLLFSGVTIDIAAKMAERLRKVVESNPCGEAGKITVSIGVVQYRREESESINGVIKRADEKMYEAKKAGRNTIAVEELS